MAPRRNIMRKFDIGEISGVDFPCQAPARAAIFKRAEPLGDEGEPTMLKKSLGLPETATDAEVAAALEKRAADQASLEAQVADLTKRAGLDDASRAYHADLEKSDKAKADAFLNLDEKGRKDAVALAKSGDEVITIEGQSISKRAVGDAMFAVMKAQSTRLDNQAALLAKAADVSATLSFEKRAADDFSHLAGSVEERGAVLKFLSTAPDGVKAAADAIFKAAEASTKLAFEKRGHNGSINSPIAKGGEAEIQAIADTIRKADPTLSPAMAYTKALETPEGAAAYAATIQ